MIKEPIEVERAESAPRLPRRSRIRFVGTTAVNKEEAVMDIGLVVDRDIDLLRRYWDEEREDIDDYA